VLLLYTLRVLNSFRVQTLKRLPPTMFPSPTPDSNFRVKVFLHTLGVKFEGRPNVFLINFSLSLLLFHFIILLPPRSSILPYYHLFPFFCSTKASGLEDFVRSPYEVWGRNCILTCRLLITLLTVCQFRLIHLLPNNVVVGHVWKNSIPFPPLQNLGHVLLTIPSRSLRLRTQ